MAAKVADRYTGDWVGDPAFADFMTFEGGWAERYRAERGHLLPEVDRQVLERALEEPRRLWRVTEVGRDQRSPSWLEDLKAGRSASLPWAIVSSDEPGAVVLWRIVHLNGVDYPLGLPVMVPPAEVDEVGRILADTPGPDALATWYCTLLASWPGVAPTARRGRVAAGRPPGRQKGLPAGPPVASAVGDEATAATRDRPTESTRRSLYGARAGLSACPAAEVQVSLGHEPKSFAP